MNNYSFFSTLALVSATSACSGGGNQSQVSAGPSQSSVGGSGNFVFGGSSGANASTKPGAGSVSTCLPRADDNGCVGEQFAGETLPLDIYILFDQSCSMSCPISQAGPGQCCTGGPNERIAPVRAALDEFLHAPESAGIGFGLGYFGGAPLGEASCSPSDYETPALMVANGQADQITSSLRRATPVGETPTGAALRGACTYAKVVKRAKPSHSVAILLVTDGVPETPVTGCGATLQDAVRAAADCAEDAKNPIKTYVLGIGQALTNLNQIASAGGSKRAHLVEGGDVTTSILAALDTIRGDAVIPCQLKIPPPPADSTLDFAAVNVGVCDANGAIETTYNVSGADQCEKGQGWYYDDPANPQRIVLCQATCDMVSAPDAQLYYSVGCATQTVVR